MAAIQPQDLVVEVFVPEVGTDGKEGQIATGYPVARDRILTARHALFPEGPGRDPKRPIEVRFRCPGVDPIWRPLTAYTVVWDSQRWDLVLLACELPQGLGPWWGFPSEERPQPNAPWYGSGFPRIGGKRDGERVSFGVGGTVKPMLATDERLQVDETAGPKDADAWKGASGAPVFMDRRIIGVILSVPEDLEARRLSVAPLWRVLAEEPEFCAQVRYQQRKDRRDALERGVRDALAATPTALTALTAVIPGAADTCAAMPASERPAKVAAALLGLEIDQAVAITEAAYRDLPRPDAPAAHAIAGIARALVPAVYDHGVVEAVRCACADAQAGLLAVPAFHPTVAEIIMAGADRRPVEVCARRSANDFPKGRLCLPEPPECGLDEDGREALKALETHLTQKLTLGQGDADALEGAADGFIVHRFDRRDGRAAARTLEQRRKLAALEIAYQASHGRTHYLILHPPEQAEDADRLHGVAQRLRERYQGLMCIALSDDFDLELAETERFRPFLDLLPLETEPGP